MDAYLHYINEYLKGGTHLKVLKVVINNVAHKDFEVKHFSEDERHYGHAWAEVKSKVKQLGATRLYPVDVGCGTEGGMKL